VSSENGGAITRLAEAFGSLPGIGPKSAERLTHYLLGADRSEALELAEALRAVAEYVHPCRQCFNLTEGELCSICLDPRRDPSILCVVEQPRDLAALERAGSYRGLYHILGGRLAPLENMGPEQLTVDALLRRVQQGGVQEVILATNPTLEGDGTRAVRLKSAGKQRSSCHPVGSRFTFGLNTGVRQQSNAGGRLGGKTIVLIVLPRSPLSG